MRVSQRQIRRIRRRLPFLRTDWTQREPRVPKCPPGWHTGPPDFVGVGAQKAGTTWWFYLIAAHPEVHQDPDQRPELHFFDRFGQRWLAEPDIARYHSLFPRPPGTMTGEKTPEYMSCYWVPQMLRQAAPDARLIVLLRDPVERYRSAMQRATRLGSPDERQTATQLFEGGHYAEQVARLHDAYPSEQILFLQYERCVRDPQAELAKTYRFLGLSPNVLTEEQLRQGRNVSRGSPTEIVPQRKAALIKLYEDEVRRLTQTVPNLDLALWPNFKHLA